MKILLMVLIGAALIIAGCSQPVGGSSQQQPPPQGSPPSGGGAQNPPPSGGQQPPQQQQQGNTADSELQACINGICGVGNDSMTRICTASCWDDYAVATKDAKICDKNFELLNSSIGYNVCVEAVAKASSDAAPCGLVKSSELDRDLCYVELAKWLKDPSVCGYVDDTDPILTKQDCINALKE